MSASSSAKIEPAAPEEGAPLAVPSFLARTRRAGGLALQRADAAQAAASKAASERADDNEVQVPRAAREMHEPGLGENREQTAELAASPGHAFLDSEMPDMRTHEASANGLNSKWIAAISAAPGVLASALAAIAEPSMLTKYGPIFLIGGLGFFVLLSNILVGPQRGDR